MSALIKKILLVLLLSSATLPAIAKNTILVVGDSLSAAYGMRPDQGWVSLLQQQLLDKRILQHQQNPGKGKPWKEIKKKYFD